MPGLGATGGGKLQVSVGWRHSVANRSYFGTHVNKPFTHTWQPYDRMSVLDVTARYSFTRRISAQITVPVVMNRFSMRYPPLGNQGERIGVSAAGLGDINMYVQSWLLKPEDHPFANSALGIGIKVPTGDWNVQGLLPNLTGQGFMQRALYPPGLMPGDGGTGIIVGANTYRTFRKNRWLRGQTVFANASYLINPRNTNGTASIVSALGVPLAPQFQNDLQNSVTDSFNMEIGASFKIPGTWDKPKLRGLRGRLAFEWQGIPKKDLIGGNSGYRQPGYAMAVAPGLTYQYGRNMLVAEAPIVFNRFIDGTSSAVPGLPQAGSEYLQAAAFSPTRNLGSIAPVSVVVRFVRTF